MKTHFGKGLKTWILYELDHYTCLKLIFLRKILSLFYAKKNHFKKYQTQHAEKSTNYIFPRKKSFAISDKIRTTSKHKKRDTLRQTATLINHKFHRTNHKKKILNWRKTKHVKAQTRKKNILIDIVTNLMWNFFCRFFR